MSAGEDEVVWEGEVLEEVGPGLWVLGTDRGLDQFEELWMAVDEAIQ